MIWFRKTKFKASAALCSSLVLNAVTEEFLEPFSNLVQTLTWTQGWTHSVRGQRSLQPQASWRWYVKNGFKDFHQLSWSWTQRLFKKKHAHKTFQNVINPIILPQKSLQPFILTNHCTFTVVADISRYLYPMTHTLYLIVFTPTYPLSSISLLARWLL